MPYMNITCGKCGHTADIDRWTRSAIYGSLKRNHFQCPKCRYAFERRLGKPEVYPNGFIMPGKVSLVEVAPTL